MRIVAVAQAFKETFSARQVASAMEAGIRAGGADPVIVIGGDGGDGLAEALASQFVRESRHNVSGPLAEQVSLDVGWLGPKTAVVESRLVCGLSLVPESRRNPLLASTRGVGELVTQLIGTGATEVFVGLGGSATMDGGLGMARAWGWRPLDPKGRELSEGGGSLLQLETLVTGQQPAARLTALVDVLNPLTGPSGAREYAAQKGATPEQADLLERGLSRLAEFARRDGKGDLVHQAGAGAAGGLGFGITFFGGGTLLSGAAWVLDRIGFSGALKGADLVICGEGAFDATSLKGKLTGSVIGRARAAGVPVALVAPIGRDVPADVALETGGGYWTLEEIARRVTLMVRRTLRT